MSLDISLNRVDRVYRPSERVSGAVVVTSDSSFTHNGLKLLVEGTVSMQVSARSIGLFEAFYSSIKPISLIHTEIEVSTGGKINKGVTEIPFEFPLKALPNEQLFDTYHGVYVNIQYTLTAEMQRGMMAKLLPALKKQREFVIELQPDTATAQKESLAKPFNFQVSPESLQNVKEATKKKIPDFCFEGYLAHTTCNVDEPLTGELCIKRCIVEIKSIELQLVRVESCTHLEGESREATEIQNIQIADGNIVHGVSIPIYMVFPRLFTCSTTISKSFRVEFEVNLIISFADNHMVTENFPLKLYR